MTTPADVAQFIDQEVRPKLSGRSFKSKEEATDAIELAVRREFADLDELTFLRGAMIAMEIAIADIEFKRSPGAMS